MKKVNLFFINLFALLCFVACSFNTTEISREKKLEYITVDVTEAEQLTYLIGQQFNANGIKVFGHYSDNTTELEDNRIIEFTGFSSEEENESLPITVSYNDSTCSFSVKIESATVSGLSIFQYPSKLYYAKTDTVLSTEGLIVLAIYSNGTKVRLTEDDYIINGFSTSTVGTKEITIAYKNDTEITTSFPIYINEYNIIDLSVVSPYRTVYMKGREHLDLAGLQVTASYDSGIPPQSLGEGYYSLQPPDIIDLDVGHHEIKIVINDIERSFFVDIVNSYVIGAVIQGNTQSLYYEGTTLNLLHDFQFYKQYSDNSIGENITANTMITDDTNTAVSYLKYSYNIELTDDQFDSALELTQDITFVGNGLQKIYFYYKYYDIQTQSIKIFKWANEISVADSPLKYIETTWSDENASGYPLGITPDNSHPEYGKWTIQGVLENNNRITIPPEFCTYEFLDTRELQRQKVTNDENHCYYSNVKVTYFDVRKNRQYTTASGVEVQVKVIRPLLDTVEFIQLPQTQYIVKQKINLNNLVVKLYYSDGSESLELNYLGNQDIISSSIPLDRELTTNDRMLKLTFASSINSKIVDIPIKVVNADITSLTITKKPDASLKFRKSKVYTSQDFLNRFTIRPEYNNGVIGDELTDASKFSFKLQTENNLTSLYVVYKPEEISYSTVYRYDAQLNNTPITIYPALPKYMEVTPPASTTFYSLNNVIKDLNTKYKIIYEDGTSKEFTLTDENITDDIVTFRDYLDASNTSFVGTYTIENVDNQYMKISFEVCEQVNEENDSNTKKTFNVYLIKGINLKPKTEYQDSLRFAHAHNYNYAEYFDVEVLYTNGTKQIVSANSGSNETNEISFYTSYSVANIHKKQSTDGKVFVTYKYGEIEYTDYYNVEFYPPFPKELTISSLENDSSIEELNDNIKYKVKYEDDFEEIKIMDSNSGTSQFCPVTHEKTEDLTSKIYSKIEYKTNYAFTNVLEYASTNTKPNVNGKTFSKDINYESIDIDVNQTYSEKDDFKLRIDSTTSLAKLFDVTRNYKINISDSEDPTDIYLKQKYEGESTGGYFNYKLNRKNGATYDDKFKKCDGYVVVNDKSNAVSIYNKYGKNANSNSSEKDVFVYPHVTDIQIIYNDNPISNTPVNLYYGIGENEDSVINWIKDSYKCKLIISDGSPKIINFNDPNINSFNVTKDFDENQKKLIYKYAPNEFSEDNSLYTYTDETSDFFQKIEYSFNIQINNITKWDFINNFNIENVMIFPKTYNIVYYSEFNNKCGKIKVTYNQTPYNSTSNEVTYAINLQNFYIINKQTIKNYQGNDTIYSTITINIKSNYLSPCFSDTEKDYSIITGEPGWDTFPNSDN